MFNYKKNFIFLYIVLIGVVIFFAFLYLTLFFNIKLPFTKNIFDYKSLEVISAVTYIEGDEIFYYQKGTNKKIVNYLTKLKNDIVIETGKNSYAGFYVKDEGFYFLYPNSSLYIKKLETYKSDKSSKESFFILEKGLLYSNINFYSKNSYLIIETPELYSQMSKGKFLIDKNKNFQTNISCLDGSLYFRAFSSKFEFYEEKKSYVITDSIERLINSGNILTKNESAFIDVNHQKKLDNTLNKVYESKNTKLIDKESIKSDIEIPVFELDDSTINNIIIPAFDIEKFDISGHGYLEIMNLNEKNQCIFNNININANTKYLFYIESGKYVLTENLSFTDIINNFEIKDFQYKNLELKKINGITDIYLNGFKVIFEMNNKHLENNNLNKNNIILKINNNIGKINTIGINLDISPKNIFFLSKEMITEDGFIRTQNHLYLGNEVYYIYNVKKNNDTNLQLQFSEPLTEKNVFFLIEFEKEYYYDL
jgi:hypothetical protein